MQPYVFREKNRKKSMHYAFRIQLLPVPNSCNRATPLGLLPSCPGRCAGLAAVVKLAPEGWDTDGRVVGLRDGMSKAAR